MRVYCQQESLKTQPTKETIVCLQRPEVVTGLERPVEGEHIFPSQLSGIYIQQSNKGYLVPSA